MKPSIYTCSFLPGNQVNNYLGRYLSCHSHTNLGINLIINKQIHQKVIQTIVRLKKYTGTFCTTVKNCKNLTCSRQAVQNWVKSQGNKRVKFKSSSTSWSGMKTVFPVTIIQNTFKSASCLSKDQTRTLRTKTQP